MASRVSLRLRFAVPAVMLVIGLVLLAGCTTIPGPDTRFTPIPTTTAPVQVTPQAKVTALPATLVPVTPTPALPATPVTVITQGIYETRACAAQGGFVVAPGNTCPGAWLLAGDTFNCCTAEPVREGGSDASVVIGPLDVVIVMDDDPGSLLP